MSDTTLESVGYGTKNYVATRDKEGGTIYLRGRGAMGGLTFPRVHWDEIQVAVNAAIAGFDTVAAFGRRPQGEEETTDE